MLLWFHNILRISDFMLLGYIRKQENQAVFRDLKHKDILQKHGRLHLQGPFGEVKTSLSSEQLLQIKT